MFRRCYNVVECLAIGKGLHDLGYGSDEGNDYSDEPIGISSPPPADPTIFSHDGCGAPLERMQRYCGGCGQEIDWDGLL